MNTLDQKVIEMGEEIFRLYGLDNLSAKIISTLYFEPHELSMEEIAESTGYSLSSISLKMGPLENVWGVKRIKKAGSRKAYFYVEKNMSNIMIELFMKACEIESRLTEKYLPPIIEEYREKAVDEYEIERLSILENYCSQLEGFKQLLEVMIELLPEIQSNVARENK
ncbi:hypothetical protein V7O62_10995 [Methanolobus sp. ZRKC2]|uniref:GbsR/MarR family transcriptional regulator n=1 Tax=Methanolobus sp. ZRKC2 TaxID=3125783 RepID=UPI00325516EF